MIKYGIMHEYKCACGYCIVTADNDFTPRLIKSAGLAEGSHMHTLVQIKEVVDGGESESGIIRSDELVPEKQV